jgi:hypothetical protein
VMDSPSLSRASANGVERPINREIIYFCQVIAIYLIIIACVINLSLGSDKDSLWSSLLSGSLGYLLPSPKIRRRNDTLLPDVTQQ